MSTLGRVQQQVDEWASRNFPERLPYRSLLGAVEELGELAHAQLKSEQKIRGSSEEHQAAKADALGDLLVYLCDYSNLVGIDLEKALSDTWQKVRDRDWQSNPLNGRSQLIVKVEDQELRDFIIKSVGEKID